MKESFRKLKLNKNISIKTTRYDIPYWETNTSTLYIQIEEVLKEFRIENIKLTQRQLYYQLVGKDLIPNDVNVYKRLCRFVTDCRYAGLIDWNAIEDRGRIPKRASQWDSVKDIVDSAVYSYRLPRWNDQEYYLEMYCEKDAMTSVLNPIAKKYHIYFGANKGYSSASAMYELAKRLYDKMCEGKNVRLLYFGDHDASGIDMIRDIKKRLCEFFIGWDDRCDYKEILVMIKDGDYGDESDYLLVECELDFDTIAVALTQDQIEEFNLPPNPAKQTDPRAKDYISKFGNVSWELDALKPQDLKAIATNSILNFIDLKKYNDYIEKENEQKKKLIAFAEKL